MNFQPFNQPPPRLGNQYDDDRVLRSYLQRHLPPDVLTDIEPSLREMGGLSGGELYEMQLADRLNEPVLTQWDAWGERIDHIEVTPLWKRAERLAAEYGLVAAAYEQTYGRFSRVYQFALAYLFHPSTDVYTCPLAMTDGAARTLSLSGNRPLIDRAIPRLTSRDPDTFWTSGQWMTESTGGSDVGRSETVAMMDEDDVWRLYGRKWFTSATTSQMTLTLARPEGNGTGGRGLALFYVELRDENGRLRNIQVNRLKDKLGTRKVPTAELTLDGTPATPVIGLNNGVRNIIPMLHLTRTWNSIAATSTMRRGMALARDYARRRVAFGAPLSQQPLHVDTLAGLQAETEAAFHLSFFLVDLLGRDEAGENTPEEAELLRLLTSVVKLTTGRQGVAVVSEVLEAHGGAGYVEDTGLPLLLRDVQVTPIWEGTTNVLALDTLRALSHGPTGLIALRGRIAHPTQPVTDPALATALQTAISAADHAIAWLENALGDDKAPLEAGARRFAMTLGRSLALALLVEHAEWSVVHEQDGRAKAAACRFAQTPIDLIQDEVAPMVEALAQDQPLPVTTEDQLIS
ncbi:MAG: acyl-CoA dehydrogenase family protein [Chloroflexota bacterium]